MKLLLLAVVSMCCSAAPGTLMPFTTDERNDILVEHFKARKDTGANLPSLVWDVRLVKTAGDWLKNCRFEHSEDVYVEVNGKKVPAGQNLWQGFTSAKTYRPSGTNAVKAWVREKAWYDYDANKCNAPPGKACGHYTQVVWADTTRVGCARVRCPDSDNFRRAMIACDYAPGGNYRGQRPYKKGGSATAPQSKPVAPAGNSNPKPAPSSGGKPKSSVEEHWETIEEFYPDRSPSEQHETVITHYGPDGEVLAQSTTTEEHYGPPKSASNQRLQRAKAWKAKALESLLAEIGTSKEEPKEEHKYEFVHYPDQPTETHEVTVDFYGSDDGGSKKKMKSTLNEKMKRLIAALQALKQ